MTKVAVTGATGFIGKHVIAELSKNSHIDIVALTRSKLNIPQPHKNINHVVIDILNPPDKLFEAIGKPDLLIHLAWSHMDNYMALEHFEIDLVAHYFFLKKLVSQGLKNLFLSGTCFEYGLQSGELSASLHTQPITPYGFAKDSLRTQLNFLQKKISYNLTWGRLFYIYGNGQAKNTLYQQLKKSIEQDEKIFKMSGGEQLRDYLSVQKVAKQIIETALIKQNLQVINICSGRLYQYGNFYLTQL